MQRAAGRTTEGVHTNRVQTTVDAGSGTASIVDQRPRAIAIWADLIAVGVAHEARDVAAIVGKV